MADEESVSFNSIVVTIFGSLIAAGIIAVVGIRESSEFSLIRIIGATVLIFLTSIATRSTAELAKTERIALVVTSLYLLGVLSVAWLASENVVFQDSVPLVIYFSFVGAGLLLSTRVFRESRRAAAESD